jgi:hypothetical protein
LCASDIVVVPLAAVARWLLDSAMVVRLGCRPFSLLGYKDAGENPFLLTLSGDDVIGAAGVIPFLKATSGISVAYLGSAVDRRWPLCEDVFFLCCFFSSFSGLCGSQKKLASL